jgi:hypothetical protein
MTLSEDGGRIREHFLVKSVMAAVTTLPKCTGAVRHRTASDRSYAVRRVCDVLIVIPRIVPCRSSCPRSMPIGTRLISWENLRARVTANELRSAGVISLYGVFDVQNGEGSTCMSLAYTRDVAAVDDRASGTDAPSSLTAPTASFLTAAFVYVAARV